MTQTAWILVLVTIGYPVFKYYQAKTRERLERIVVPTNAPKRKRKGPPPPPDKLPPLVGNVVERGVARKLLP